MSDRDERAWLHYIGMFAEGYVPSARDAFLNGFDAAMRERGEGS